MAGPFRAAVIGYGYAGRCFHSYLIGLAPGLELHGIASRNPETRARIRAERGCRAYESFEAVIEDADVDLVVLATPHHLHAPHALQAMDAGKHVVTDKPMCLTLAECDDMIAAARRNGVLLNVFQNRRFDGDYLTNRKLMEDGELGDVKWIEAAWQKFGPSRGWRATAAMGGGKLYDLGAHLVDQLCMLFPQAVQSVYCRMHYDYPEIDIESEALLVIGFEGGKTGVCDFSMMAAISKPRFYVRATKGTFRKYGFDPQEGAMCAGDIDAAVNAPETYGILHDGTAERAIPTVPGRWRDYYENISAVLNDGAEPVVRLAEVRREIAILGAAFRSARSGEVVRLHIPGLHD